MASTKKLLALVLVTALLSSLFITAIPMSVSAAYDNSNTYTITGFDTTPPSSAHSSIYVYPNTGLSARVIKASDYTLESSKLFIFNADGKLIEAGENIYPNSDTVTGSPQLTINVPAGGFMVAFGANASDLVNCYNTAMEGAMLYNATMSVIYDVKGSYNKSTNKLTIEYNNPKTPSSSAKKFMVVGNSTTYFNGIPIKFKGIAQAAGIEIDVTYCTKGSSYLSDYASTSTDCGQKFRNLLNQNKFDYVVLQDAGKANYSQSKPALDTLMPLITANGAKALLYKRYASESNAADRLVYAKVHHDNYTQLAEDFNIDMVAPVADAFLISDLKYPEINLYADDNSHHSKEGSYLAALVWAITYLGIDVTDNSYTADLPADTVAALKECAKLACEVGYFDAPEMEEYENLTLGNSYTISAEPPSGAPDSTGKELTDGVVAKDVDMSSPYYSDDRWVGLSFSSTVNEVEIVMPLGDGVNVSDLWKVTVNAGTSAVTGGCHEPHFTVYYSVDGENYHPFGSHTSTDASSGIAMNFSVSSDSAVKATHVKLVFSPFTGVVCRVSEISAFGYKTNLKRINTGSAYTISTAAPSSGNPGDTNNKELTDGEIVRDWDIAAAKYDDERWVGLSFSGTVRTIDVVMPLGDGKTPVKLSEVWINYGTDAIGAGVTEPSVIVYASSNGTDYSEFGRYDRVATTTKYATDLTIEGVPVTATHIKVSFSLISGRNVCRVSEIAAYERTAGNEIISKGCDYTLSAEPPSGAPDPDLSKLTDGKVVTHEDIVSPYYNDTRWVGMGFSSDVREVSVLMTLNGVTEFNEVVINIGSEKIGAGVTEPDFKVEYSTDGSTFKEFGSYTRTGDTAKYVIDAAVTGTPVKAQYIKITFSFYNSATTCRIGEISVYGATHEHSVDSTLWETSATQHWHVCSCGDKFNIGNHDSGEWVGESGSKALKCTVCGYVLDDTPDALPEDAENLALNQTYTSTLEPSASYPDGNKELTDGVVLSAGTISTPYYGDSKWVGYILNGSTRSFDIVMPIGDGVNASQLYKVAVNVGTKACTSGVYEPNLKVYYSENSTDWTEFGTYNYRAYEDQTEPVLMVSMAKTEPVKANYIKVNVSHPEFNLMWLSEIEAWGVKGVEGDDDDISDDSSEPSSSEEPSEPSSSEVPSAPSSSEEPSEPSSSIEPSEPSCSEEPSDPSNSEDPSETDDPSKPEDPIDPKPEDPKSIKGDVNGNGKIDSMDYVLLKRAYFGTYKLKDIAIGDLNDNGKIDSMDYVYLRRAYFGTYTIK